MKHKTRETAHIFDLTIKYLLQGTSSATKVYLINGLFERRYDTASLVQFRRTESVKNRGTTLEQFRSDTIMSIEHDDFVVEFQIGDDELIGLRIFEYGLQHGYENKEITKNGALIELPLPEACVVYWENTPSTPNVITLRFKNKSQDKVFEYEVKVFKMAEQDMAHLEEQKLVVLLPFCLLKFRKDLKKAKKDAQKRQDLAQAERQMIDDLEGILERSRDRQLISNGDCIMVLESIAQMHKELYNTYAEFEGTSIDLDDRIKLRWKTREQELIAHEQEAVEQAVKREHTKVLKLLRQGYTADEIERLLAQEEGKVQ